MSGSNWRVPTTQEGLGTKTATHPEVGMVGHPPEVLVLAKPVDTTNSSQDQTSNHNHLAGVDV